MSMSHDLADVRLVEVGRNQLNQPRRLGNSSWVVANMLIKVGCGGLALAAAVVSLGAIGLILSLALAIAGGTLLICGCVGRHVSAKLQEDLNELESGEATALHWTYSREEWSAYVANERTEAKGHVLVGSLLFGFFALFVGWGVANGATSSASWSTAFALTVAAGTALGAVFGWLIELGIHWKCNRMQHQIGEAYIGRRGLYFNGSYRRWRDMGSRLVSVNLLDDRAPLTIEFCFLMDAGRDSTHHYVRVPVPEGQEEVALAYAESVNSV